MLSVARKCFPRIGRRLLVTGSSCIRRSAVRYSECVALAQSVLVPSYSIRFYSQRSKCPPISQTSPELLHYWHPTKNVNVTPDDVSIKSFDKVWWKCPKGVDHEWECSVRYALKSDGKTVNCPFCFNKRVSITNSLATRYPEIAAQWHPTKNGSLLPSQVTYVSNTAVWWQCDRDPAHVWKREIRKRVHPSTALQGIHLLCLLSRPVSLLQWHPSYRPNVRYCFPRDRQGVGLRAKRRAGSFRCEQVLLRRGVVEVQQRPRMANQRE